MPGDAGRGKSSRTQDTSQRKDELVGLGPARLHWPCVPRRRGQDRRLERVDCPSRATSIDLTTYSRGKGARQSTPPHKRSPNPRRCRTVTPPAFPKGRWVESSTLVVLSRKRVGFNQKLTLV